MKLSSLRNWIVVAIVTVCASATAQLQRVPNTTLAMPTAPPTYGYTYANAFPGLIFTNPICIVSPPGETNRLFILGKNGIITVITNLVAPTWTTFMDLTPQVSSTTLNSGTTGERGLLGMAFHPGFATNGFFYIVYMPTNSASGGYYDRLSRFTISATNPNRGDTNSQVVLYTQADPDPNHNSGDVHFGADGYLYVSVGDEGNEHDGFNCAQIITNSLFSGILRIDVDKRPGNLTPNPGTSALTVSANYLIPADNPFIGITNFDGRTVNSNLVRTEFYAVGLRNPWRWNFDFNTNVFGTNVLYCGDVGQDHYEEVDVIQKGDNLGWAYWEGTNVSSGGTLPHTTYVATQGTQVRFPIVHYAHGSLANQGNCVIGGVVYRGSNLPQLYGNYVYCDYVSGNIWTLVASNYTASVTNVSGAAGPTTPIISDSSLNITAFGTDPRNGDVLFCATKTTGYATAATIDKIIYNNVTNGAPLPETLYDTGAFTNLLSLTSAQDSLQPASGILPYQINVPFWSDNAIKTRWFSIPNTNLTMDFNASGNWNFPTGMVWIKNFNLELTNGDPTSTIRLETRFIVKNSSGVYGATYIWNSKTNAVLAPASGMDTNYVINDGGVIRTQTWHFPSQAECLACHTSAGGFGLGFRTEQLNDTMDYGFGATNEIQALSAAGYFSSLVTNDVHSLLALATATNTAYSLEFRSRSFLAANCSQCHQPQGTAQQSSWDARITTPTALAGLINGALANNLGDSANAVIAPQSPEHSVLLTRDAARDLGSSSSIQMPPLDSYMTDIDATNVVAEWILSLTNQFWIGGSPDSQTVTAGDEADYSITFVNTPDFTSDVALSVSGLPSGASVNFSPANVNSATTNSTLAITTSGSTPNGTYTLTVTGIGGGTTNTDTITLVVGQIVAAPGTLIWNSASGVDTNWSTILNWTNVVNGGYGPPGISNDVIFNNMASGRTNFEDFSMTINSLWFGLRPPSSGSLGHSVVIQPGTTLNIVGTNILTGSSFITAGYSLLVGTNTSVSGNGNGSSVFADISGAGGALNINRPDSVVAVAEYISTGNHPLPASSTRAILDMSGLDNFSATISQLLIGCMNNGSAGTFYLAKTNVVTTSGGSATSGTTGIDIGNNNSNAGDASYLYLGLTNRINVNSIRAGTAKGFWGLIAFNPAFISQNPTAWFRSTGGDNSRVSAWIISDLSAANGTANVTQPKGTNDFTGGTINALVDGMALGKTTATAIGGAVSSNRVSLGVLTFNAGTIDVNNLTNGFQLANPGGTIPAGDSSDSGVGIVNVNGGTLKVNNNLVLGAGVSALMIPRSPDGVLVPAIAQGTLNINGGTVAAAQIIAGNFGLAFINMNNGILILTNIAASPAKSLATFALTNSVLHLNLNGNSIFTNVCVTNLVASGINTISIDSAANVTSAKTFPLVSYDSFTGSVAVNFVKGSLPNGFVANLVDNSTQHRIDLVIAASTNATPHFATINEFGNNFIFSGSNGLPDGIYYVLASTNVALPLNLWTPISTNPFDADGAFSFTNPMSTNAQLFYLLQLP